MLKSDNKESLRTFSWSENVELKKKDCELVKKKLDSSLKFIIVYIAYFSQMIGSDIFK